MYGNFNTVFKLKKQEMIIKHRCCVRQGDILSPTLFIVVLKLFAEGALSKFKNNNVEMPTKLCDPTSIGALNHIILSTHH